ncbi:MAG: CoA-binding protein [Acholeplasmatales bacterium]|nr:CoA-binding protein [Acholeplasmatales bacterium]
MKNKDFVVIGDTLNPDKYAYKIKHKLQEYNYNVESVHKELKSINEVSCDNFILDLCINPILGLKYLKECKKNIKCVLIQPGAESEELEEYLKNNNIDFIEGCALVGVSLYKSKL